MWTSVSPWAEEKAAAAATAAMLRCAEADASVAAAETRVAAAAAAATVQCAAAERDAEALHRALRASALGVQTWRERAEFAAADVVGQCRSAKFDRELTALGSSD